MTAVPPAWDLETQIWLQNFHLAQGYFIGLFFFFFSLTLHKMKGSGGGGTKMVRRDSDLLWEGQAEPLLPMGEARSECPAAAALSLQEASSRG